MAQWKGNRVVLERSVDQVFTVSCLNEKHKDVHVSNNKGKGKCSMCKRQVEDGVSEWFSVKVGLRQGCVLSPWLFNLFMDGVMKELKANILQRGVKFGMGKNAGRWVACCLWMTQHWWLKVRVIAKICKSGCLATWNSGKSWKTQGKLSGCLQLRELREKKRLREFETCSGNFYEQSK